MYSIKKILKKTTIYQDRRNRIEFNRRRYRNPPIEGKLKSVHACRRKIDQIEKILKIAEVDYSCEHGFFYSIDERVIPFAYGHVVDNIPFNYSEVINNSLNELKPRNPELISIFVRYIEKVSRNITDETIKNTLLSMIDSKATSLLDALQRILFWNQMLWQTGHRLIGLGRLDKILAPFVIDEELIRKFLLLLHEHYNFKSSAMVGDTGQIIILGGLESNGAYFCNEYTYAIIKILGDLVLPDPKILLRVTKYMPDNLLGLAIDSISTGCGSPLLSNDDVVIPALIEFGYGDDAYNYGVSACWEPLAIGKSLEQNNLFDIEFGFVFGETIKSIDNCGCFDDLMEAYKINLKQHINSLCAKMNEIVFEEDPIFSITTDSCWQNNVDISKGGAKYNNYGLLSVGLASAVDSLLNIKRYVFDSNMYNFDDVKNGLLANYNGFSEMRKLFKELNNGYGTNNDEAVEITNAIIMYAKEILSGYTNPLGGKVKFGLSSPAYVNGGKRSIATADGRCNGEPFATHISRSKGDPITDIIEFSSALDYAGISSNGNVVDLIVQPNLLKDNAKKFIQYLKSSIKQGFFQMQFNVLTYEQLIDAKAHPKKYPNLIVRVWGFSAYFNDLPENYKDALIERAKGCYGGAL